ncbi:MAG: hypothetical protein K6G25_02495 [Bacteroidales bacterium]|nr:hypothetical protein [Bacteroidales bacterium]
MRTVLFLNESYIESFDEMRKLMLSHNGKSKKSKCFGKELLGLFDDGILEKWLIEHNGQQMADNLSLELKAPNLSDNNKIAIVYKIIAGIECKIDFESEFFEMAELLGYEKNGKTLPFENKDHLEARIDDTNSEVKFVFKAIEDIDTPLYFALRKIGFYSVVGEGFSIGEPGLTAMMINTINSGDEFSVSFSFEDISVMDRKGKYLLKLLGKKSELICELVYDVKEETIVKLLYEFLGKEASRLSKVLSELVRSYYENNVKGGYQEKLYVSLVRKYLTNINKKEKFVEFENGDKLPLYYIVGTHNCSRDFWVLCDNAYQEKGDVVRKYLTNIEKHDGTRVNLIEKQLNSLNNAVIKGLFRLLNKYELEAFFRWATFWNDDLGIDIGFYFVYGNNDIIRFCNVDLEDVDNPPFYLMYLVYEEN